MENKMEVSTTTVVSAETENAVANVPTLEQRVVKIQFHLQSMGQSAIIIGQELIECKKEVGHGNWANWIKENFNLSDRTARQFTQIAERFSNRQTFANLGYSQMIQMLALPEGEEEKFIAEKAAEGKPVEDMTVKKLRAEIEEWKEKAEKQKLRAVDAEKRLNARNEQYSDMIKTYNRNFFEMREEKEAEAAKVREEYEKHREEKEKEIAALQSKIAELAKKLEEPVVEVIPEDYEQTKEELARLKSREENFREEIATSQALNQFFMLANFLQEHQNCLAEVLKGYVKTDGRTAERINQIASVSTFLKKILKDIG